MPNDKGTMMAVTHWLPVDLVRRLRERAEREDRSASAVVRRALAAELARDEERQAS